LVQLNKSILFLLFFLSEVIAIDYDGLSINGYTTLGFTYSEIKIHITKLITLHTKQMAHHHISY
jgi:hypothetical protein